MELRIKVKLSETQKLRWEELQSIFGTTSNAKTIKRILEEVKL